MLFLFIKWINILGSGGATIRNLRATTGALLNFSWENASQHSEGLIKIGGLRPCRQKAQEKINEILKDVQCRVFGRFSHKAIKISNMKSAIIMVTCNENY